MIELDGPLTELAAAFVLAVVSAVVLMPVAIHAGQRFGMVSVPRLFDKGPRQISYLGGVALSVGATIGFGAFHAFAADVRHVLVGGFVVLALGFSDDRFNHWVFNPAARLVVQFAVALAFLAIGIGGFPGVLGSGFTVVFLVACMNGFNLLDNMDGVAGSTAAATAAGIAGVAFVGNQTALAALALALCGACLSFLRFNFRNARLYLGNGGSLFLGLVLGGLAMMLRPQATSPARAVGMLALLVVPLTDTTFVTVSRFIHKRKVTVGGIDHISHGLVRLGFAKQSAAMVHAGSAMSAGALVVLAFLNSWYQVLYLVPAFFGCMGLVLLALTSDEGSVVSRRRVWMLVSVASLGLGVPLLCRLTGISQVWQ